MAKMEKTVTTTAEAQPEALTMEAALQQKLDDTQAELATALAQVEDFNTQLSEAHKAKEALAQELNALRKSSKPASVKTDSREALRVRATKGKSLWRGGVLFTDEWQVVKCADVGEEAWQRILDEPALQREEAE